MKKNNPNDRCDKCGTHISEWKNKPCVRSLTQSPRHTITRFHIPMPGVAGSLETDPKETP